MTPPDQPEEAPSALSRLERALAGFGDPKADEETAADVVVESEPDVEAEPEAEAEPEPESEEEEQWAAPSNSVLDIAAAVAAVEQLSARSETADEPSDADEPEDDDADVGGEPDDDEPDDVANDDELPYFQPADLRARVEEFATEDEPEPEDIVEDVAEDDAVDAGEEDRNADAAQSWERNVGDASLPYFLVDETVPAAADVQEVADEKVPEAAEEPAPRAVSTPADSIAAVEELRHAIVRPDAEPEPKEPASIARTLAEIPVLLIVAAVIAFLVKTFLAQAYYIPSGSMLPQLQIDDRVVVSKLAYKVHDPRRGDIIVFDDPRNGTVSGKPSEGLLRKVGEGIGIVQPSTDEFIKRVIGLPGEIVEGKNGAIYVNGQKLIEPYLQPTVVTSDFPETTVKKGHLWVMGDNRSGSADSRVFGQIEIDTIVGRALVKVWPFDHISFL